MARSSKKPQYAGVVAYFQGAPSHDHLSSKSVAVDESTDLEAVVARYVELGAVSVVAIDAEGGETVLYPTGDEDSEDEDSDTAVVEV